MTREQKIVAMGAASGVAGMAFSVWVLTQMLPSPGIESVADNTLQQNFVFAIASLALSTSSTPVACRSSGPARSYS